MRSNENRPERFYGISLGVPKLDETREVMEPRKKQSIPEAGSGSVVEASVCFSETLRELGQYFNTLTDAEILAMHARIVFSAMPAGNELAQRAIRRLGVENTRLSRISEEASAIVLG